MTGKLSTAFDPPSLYLPVPPSVEALCDRLNRLASHVAQNKVWPQQSIDACRETGVFRWFVPQRFGGWEWNEQQILSGYFALSQSCLSTTFIVTQWHAACRRILASPNAELVERMVPRLADGSLFTTVGISHLTTSRQHAATPVLRAASETKGFRLQGFSPWVTAGAHADVLVLGATLPDQSQILAAVDSNSPGVRRHPGLDMIALSASCTDRIDLEDVLIDRSDILFGPAPNVLSLTDQSGVSTGGLQTSVLAVGVAAAAASYIRQQATQRPSLVNIADKLVGDVGQLMETLQQMIGGSQSCSATDLRRQANSLVLRATQAALQTAKGTGFIEGHPAGRWAREALFFLVWSCPQAVVDANLCELAGLEVAN